MVERDRYGQVTQDLAELAKLRAKKGQSLWKDAWRRLRKNKAAMVGLVVTVFVSLLAILADVVVPIQPDYGQPWLQTQAPGFEHPAVLAENRFDVGKPVVVPNGIPDKVADMLSEDGEIVYTAHNFLETEYRVRVRKNKVRRRGIKLLEGAVNVDKLEVNGEHEFMQLLDDDGNPGPKFFDLMLEPRNELPEPLRDKGRVLVVRVREMLTDEAETITVRIEGGLCTAIDRSGNALELLRLDGRFVHRVEQNGEEQRLKHWFGTDTQGRDVLARVVYGGRISLMVGAVATVVSVLIGVIYGAIAGYLASKSMSRWALFGALSGMVFSAVAFWVTKSLPTEIARLSDPLTNVDVDVPWYLALLVTFAAFGSWVTLLPRWTQQLPAVFRKTATTVGEFMMRIVDIAYALPFMFLVILLMISFGQDIFTLFVALGLVQWLTMARIVRGQVLSLKEKEFIEAAHMSGAGHMSILFRHLIPNTLGVVVVYSTLMIPAVILQESFLAFIGLTVEFKGRTLDSWGSLIDLGRKALTSTGGNWWVLLFPSVAMAVTLFSLNFLGDGLRDALDPQQRGRT